MRASAFVGSLDSSQSHAETRRAARILAMIVCIVAMSMADLYMTLTHVTTIGMGEANPIARLVMSYNSPALLAFWKCACVAVTCLILFKARHRPIAELAAWISIVILTALTVHWIRYSNEAASMTSDMAIIAQTELPTNWVRMTIVHD
jgi:hypothetical protein